jgi:Domain of unknown function (DUF6371)
MDKYAPLTLKERADGGNPPKPREDDGWQIVMPIPAGAPRPPDAHSTLGKPSARWHYSDKNGEFLFAVYRWNKTGGGKIFLPLSFWRHDSGGLEWRWKAHLAPRPLYGLDKLAARPNAPVLVCEGEKSADAATRIFPDCVATTSPGGSQSASKADWTPLGGRQVTIWPDADETGAKYAAEVAHILQKIGCRVSIVDAMELASRAPNGGARQPEQGWDAADAEVEWDVGALRKAVAELAKPYALKSKPELVIHSGNLPATAEALRDLLAVSGKLFDRGLPVRVIRSREGGLPSAAYQAQCCHRGASAMPAGEGERERRTRPRDIAGSRRTDVSRYVQRVVSAAARRS